MSVITTAHYKPTWPTVTLPLSAVHSRNQSTAAGEGTLRGVVVARWRDLYNVTTQTDH